MKRIGLLIGFLSVLVFLVPLSGQDAKKDVDKKDAAKTDDKKDPDKKDPDKKDPDKKEKKAIEKIVYGTKFVTKIIGLKGETNREYTIQVQEIDPAKVANVQKWSAARQQQLAQQLFNISRIDPKDVQGRVNAQAQYQKDLFDYKVELARQQTQVYTAKNLDVRAADTAKVRTLTPPIEFDDQGFQKKWTKKELDALRDKSPLHLSTGGTTVLSAPGYPSDLDAVKQGQNVEIYMAKVASAKKDNTKKKKGPADDDPPAAKDQASEFVLIVILQDGK